MFSSVGWWFLSVVVVGILINVASNYLFPLIDKQWERYSTRRLKANEKRRADIAEEVALMLADPLYYTECSHQFHLVSMGVRINSVVIFIIVVLVLASTDKISAYVGTVVSLLFLAYTLYDITLVEKLSALIKEYWRQKRTKRSL